jgi:osmoprotectant transport system permease protein
VFINTHAGIRAADRDTVEAARGMGMTGFAILTDVELPMASPVIMTGIRTTAVQVVATAPLGALVAYGGLGRFIIDGFAVRDSVQIAAGAILIALLAIATDVAFSRLQRRVVPKGVAPDRKAGNSAPDLRVERVRRRNVAPVDPRTGEE